MLFNVNTEIHKKHLQTLVILNFALLDCLSTLSTTPIADMKTSKLVEPAEMKGSGSPVGGIDPVTTAMFRIV